MTNRPYYMHPIIIGPIPIIPYYTPYYLYPIIYWSSLVNYNYDALCLAFQELSNHAMDLNCSELKHLHQFIHTAQAWSFLHVSTTYLQDQIWIQCNALGG